MNFRRYLWLLKDPARWQHTFHLVLDRLRTSGGQTKSQEREDATAWCESVAIPMVDAAAHLGLTLPDGELLNVPKAALTEAGTRVAETGARMGGAGALDFIYTCVRLTRPTACVETGVAFGWSSLAILTALEENGDGRLVSVDMPYPLRNTESFVGAAVPDHLRARWKLIRKPDRNGLVEALKALPGGIQFAHYDSDKSVTGRGFAYPRLWAALKPGGLLISDDINDNLGFKTFAEAAGRDFVVFKLDNKYVGALRR